MSNHGPILIELDEAEGHADVAAAPEIEDPQGFAMQAAVASLARPRGGGIGRWVLATAGALISLVLGVAAWDFAMRLIERVPVLGWLAAGLSVLLVLALCVWALREWLGYRRVRRLDALRRQAETALERQDLTAARAVAAALAGLYGAARVDPAEALDAEAVIEGAEGAFLMGEGLENAHRICIQRGFTWDAWLSKFVPFLAKRTANRYRRLYRRFEQWRDLVSFFETHALHTLALGSTPDDAIQAAIAEAAQGRFVGAKHARQLIEQFSDQKPHRTVNRITIDVPGGKVIVVSHMMSVEECLQQALVQIQAADVSR